MNEQDVKKYIEKYKEEKDLYEDFAQKVLNVIKAIIENELPEVKIASYSSRAKTIDSLTKKLQKNKYNADSEITDLAGARIIAYSRKDIAKIEDIVKKNFAIDVSNSINKTSTLGNDKVGYRGCHYVVSYDAARMQMPENKKYKNRKCEVQITSLIAHTWSEITHEKGYKFEGELPAALERRKNLLAGMLELADLEMDEYVQAYDSYVYKIKQEVEQGGLELLINSMSLEKYMRWKFPTMIPQVFRDIDEVIKELNLYGLKTIGELNKLVSRQFEQCVHQMEWRSSDGIIRNILILSNADKYFSEVWNSAMKQMNQKNYELYKHFGVDIDKYIKEKGISVI